MSKLVGIAVTGTVVCVLMKKYAPAYAVFAEVCSVIIVAFLSYPYLCDMVDLIKEYSTDSGIDISFIRIIIKALGIATVTQFASDICKDNGSSALAGNIEFAGKLLMLVSAVPIIRSLIELTVRIIDSG